jgi:predicted RNA binding protein YcfA (HicA-like mRNA interferase family)
VKLPRDISGIELAKALSRVGYETTRQSGSHIRLTLYRLGF